MAHIPIDYSSIKLQGRSKLIFAHARKIVVGINVSRLAKKELLEGRESTRTERIDNPAKRDFQREPLCTGNGHKLEVIWKDPRPIGNEVILS